MGSGKTKVISLILYFTSGIIFVLLPGKSPWQLYLVIKALIIPFLIMFFISGTRLHRGTGQLMIIAALLFSWFGDILLEIPSKTGSFFVPGLLSFLIAHIMYFLVFIKTPGKNYLVSWRLLWLIPVFLFGFFLVSFLYNDLNELKLPVIIYAIVILSMLSAAINRKEKVNTASFRLVIAGAILFVVSDSSIAVSKFSFRFSSPDIVIMSTYLAAQYLIISGLIKQFPRKESKG